MMICIDKENETGTKILVDNNSYRVTVCDQSNKYSNDYETAISNKSLFAMINGKIRQMTVTAETIRWLIAHSKTVDAIRLEMSEANKCPLSSVNASDGVKKLQEELKEHGWTNKKLNEIYEKAYLMG
jgi:replication fork clamp-binding protein CrfC